MKHKKLRVTRSSKVVLWVTHLIHHLLVGDKSSGREHHPTQRPDSDHAFDTVRYHADDRAGLVHYQLLDAGIFKNRCIGFLERTQKPLHQAGTTSARNLRLMGTRGGPGDLDIGPTVFIARINEAIVGGRLFARLRIGASLEGYIVGLEPIEHLETAITENTDLGLIRPRTTGGHEKLEHILGRILDPTSYLNRRAATQIDQSSGIGRGTSPTAGALQRDHPRARLARFDRGARTRTTQAHDHDVGLMRPFGDVCCRDRPPFNITHIPPLAHFS